MPARESTVDGSDGIMLPVGETISAEDFARLEESLHSDREHGVPLERRVKQTDIHDPITPMLATSGEGSTFSQVGGVRHRERSPQARTADESFNAPIARDYTQWAENKNRYDLPGIDTIPPWRMMERAESALARAQEHGVVGDADLEADLEADASKYGFEELHGLFRPRSGGIALDKKYPVDADLPRESSAFTLAHEIGHAIDYSALSESARPGTHYRSVEITGEEGLEEARESISSGELAESELDELSNISKRMRGDFREDSRLDPYRSKVVEATADLLASFIIEPRAAKREAPELASRVDDDFFRVLGGR